MNPTNALAELLRLQEAAHPSESDRSIVREETAEILQNDVVLQTPPFVEATTTLRELLKAVKKAKPGDSPGANAEALSRISPAWLVRTSPSEAPGYSAAAIEVPAP